MLKNIDGWDASLKAGPKKKRPFKGSIQLPNLPPKRTWFLPWAMGLFEGFHWKLLVMWENPLNRVFHVKPQLYVTQKTNQISHYINFPVIQISSKAYISSTPFLRRNPTIHHFFFLIICQVEQKRRLQQERFIWAPTIFLKTNPRTISNFKFCTSFKLLGNLHYNPPTTTPIRASRGLCLPIIYHLIFVGNNLEPKAIIILIKSSKPFEKKSSICLPDSIYTQTT